MLAPQLVAMETAGQESANDSELLDAYSGAVIGALERVAPAVTFIELAHRAASLKAPARSRRPLHSSGSGFLFTPMDTC